MSHRSAPALIGSETVGKTPKHLSAPQFSHLQNGVKPILKLGGEDDIVGCPVPPLQVLRQSELLFDFLFFDILPWFIFQPSRTIFSQASLRQSGIPESVHIPNPLCTVLNLM